MNHASSPPSDVDALIMAAPHAILVITPDFTIVAVNDAYVRGSNLTQKNLIGRNFLELFPDNPDCSGADGQTNLRASLERVLNTCAADRMPVQRHDLRRRQEQGGEIEERYWNLLNYPVLDEDGRVTHIIHQAEEVTELVLLRKKSIEREAELAAAVNVYRAIYDQGLFAGRLDLNGILTDANRSCLDLCGYKREDVIGKLFWECGWWNRSPEIQAWVKAGFERSVCGEVFRGVSPYFLADGTKRIVEYSCMPIKDMAGTVLFLVPTGIDITERYQVEKNKQATAILESIADAFLALDPNWRFTYVNHQAERVLGRNPGDLIGKVLWEEYPGLAGSEFELAYRRAANEHIASSVISYYPDHDRWYELRAYPAPDGISVYFRDVSEQKKSEEALRISEERFRVTADHAPVLIWISDTENHFHWFNKPWLEFTGRTMEQEVGNGWTENLHPDDIDRCLNTFVTSFDLRDRFTIEYRLKRHDGVYRWVLGNGIPLHGPDSEFTGYISSSVDINDRIEAEQSLKAADRRKDEFLAMLAHELRNPLAAVGTAVDVLKISSDQDNVNFAKDVIERQTRQLARLIDDLLDVSRITSGKIRLKRERALTPERS